MLTSAVLTTPPVRSQTSTSARWLAGLVLLSVLLVLLAPRAWAGAWSSAGSMGAGMLVTTYQVLNYMIQKIILGLRLASCLLLAVATLLPCCKMARSW